MKLNENLLPAHVIFESSSRVSLAREIMLVFPPSVSQRTDEWGQNIFHHIISRKPLSKIQIALKSTTGAEWEGKSFNFPQDYVGNCFNQRDIHGHTPLDYLVIRNDLPTLLYLLERSKRLHILVGEREVKSWFVLSILHFSKTIFEWLIFDAQDWIISLLVQTYKSEMLKWILKRDILDEAQIDHLLSQHLILAHDRFCFRALDRKYRHLATKYAHALFRHSPHFTSPSFPSFWRINQGYRFIIMNSPLNIFPVIPIFRSGNVMLINLDIL